MIVSRLSYIVILKHNLLHPHASYNTIWISFITSWQSWYCLGGLGMSDDAKPSTETNPNILSIGPLGIKC